jgi:hypothetical protein
MAKLLRVLLGMRTLFEGTDSPIALSINDVQINFSDTAQADQEMGQANLYDSDVTRFDIDTAELNNSSIRVVILGDDQWAPVIVVAWAELPDNVILPWRLNSPIPTLSVQTRQRATHCCRYTSSGKASAACSPGCS